MPIRVAVHPADETGCGWFRLRYPVAALADDPALDITINPPGFRFLRWKRPFIGFTQAEVKERGDKAKMAAGVLPLSTAVAGVAGYVSNETESKRTLDLPGAIDVGDADVVVFQRPLKRKLVEAITQLNKQGVATVVDIDDDLHRLPVGNPMRYEVSPRLSPDRNRHWLTEACMRATVVTVSTPALAERYGSHGRVAVLPNCVPDEYLSVEGKRNDRITIGWPGRPQTHQGDLEVTGSAVRDVMAETGAAFRAVGSAVTLKILQIEGEAITDWLELTDYGPNGWASAVASLDIGIVPLIDSEFNAAKSALKMCEMAALGVPVVASPTPANRIVNEIGIGVLATTEDDWRRELRKLVTDETWRAEVIARGRAAAEQMTYAQHAHRWAEAWAAALLIRRGKKAA